MTAPTMRRLVAAALAAFLHVSQASAQVSFDPESALDSRVVRAGLTDAEVVAVMKMVRAASDDSTSRLLSMYLRAVPLYVGPEQSLRREPPPAGWLVVDIGHICGPLCGGGLAFYLERVKGQWVIVAQGRWVT